MDHLIDIPLVRHLVITIGIVAVFLLFSRAVKRLLGFVARKIIPKTETVLDDKIIDVMLAYVKPLMVIIGLQVALREVRKGATASDLTVLQILDYGESILYIVVVILVVKVLSSVLREFINWYLDRMAADGTSSLKVTLGPLTSKVVNILVGFAALIVVLDHFGINIGSLLVSLGVGSLAVALAAQDTLANMLGGFVILVDRPFRVGDRIEIPSGQIGDVKEIGFRSTRVLNFDDNMIVIPNAELVKGRIVNYSNPNIRTRVQLKFEVAYGTSPSQVREILLRLVDAHEEVLKDPPPAVYFTATNEYSIQFTLVARVKEFGMQFATETALREEAYLAFRKEGIDVPLPQRVIQMKTDS